MQYDDQVQSARRVFWACAQSFASGFLIITSMWLSQAVGEPLWYLIAGVSSFVLAGFSFKNAYKVMTNMGLDFTDLKDDY